MRSLLLILLVTLLASVSIITSTSASELYTDRDHVVELTESNFNELVLQSNDLWFVEFYAPWCGHCQNLAPEWIKAANSLAGIVKFGAVNMDKEQEVGRPYDVRGLPTIKVFGIDKKKPTLYEGPREAKEIVKEALNQTKEVVRARLGGKAPSPKKEKKDTKKSSSSSSSSSSNEGTGNGRVIEATENSFKSEVLDNDDFVMVEFYAPWCGHCKNLAPEWKKAASQLGGIAKMVAVDATVHQGLAQKYEVRGYPTILSFYPGKKNTPEPYQQGRSASDLVRFAKSASVQTVKPKPVVQVTSTETLLEQCKEKSSLCLVTFVPHILDGGAKSRNAVLEVLKTVALKEKSKPFTYVWLEAGSQPSFEETLLMGNTQYPGVVAVNYKKGRFSPMLGSFTPETIGEFLARVMSGKESTIPFDTEKISLTSSQPWDGKDAPEEKEL